MDVRGRRLRKQSEDAAAFTSSSDSDRVIAAHVVLVNMAHMVSLTKAGEVPPRSAARCISFLLGYPESPASDPAAEDFHQQLEQDAVDAIGVADAGYLNLGKSRNDQVAAAIRMELRERLLGLAGGIASLQAALIALARRSGAAVMPGYTHLQRAQPVTLAHHLFAHVDALQRDVDRIFQLYARVNVSPMGSAALGGTDVAVDRADVARLLGFDGATTNAMDSVGSRDFAVEALACAAMTMLDISRMAEEHVIWSAAEFGFVELADEYSASSSIMPQKKNPVVAELARAKAGTAIGRLAAACAILKALPFSYNLDLQEVTPLLWGAMDDAAASIGVMGRSVAAMKVRAEAMKAPRAGDFSTATALANHLVKRWGISFREAHAIVGDLVRRSAERGTPLWKEAAAGLPAISRRLGRDLPISESEAREVLDPQRFLSSIVTPGGSNPGYIPAEAARCSAAVARTRRTVKSRSGALAVSRSRLLKIAKASATEVKTRK